MTIRNSFLARPASESRPHFGVHSYPGFHSAADMDVAAWYAHSKISTYGNIVENDEIYMTDYPVVVGLCGMSRFKKLADYDAMNFVADALDPYFYVMHKEIGENASDEEIEDKARELCDGMDQEYCKIPDDPLVAFGEICGINFQNVFHRAVDHPEFIQAFRESSKIKYQKFRKKNFLYEKFLMEITGQFRYDEDIPSSCICKVYYIFPLAPEISDYQGDQDSAEDLEEKYRGFDLIDVEDILSGNFHPRYAEVFSNGREVEEYHGTTYKRLVQSAPGIDLPIPPYPYRK